MLAEIEESSRSVSDSNATLAKGLIAALDVLDVMSTDGALGLWTAATDDVQWLLQEVEVPNNT